MASGDYVGVGAGDADAGVGAGAGAGAGVGAGVGVAGVDVDAESGAGADDERVRGHVSGDGGCCLIVAEAAEAEVGAEAVDCAEDKCLMVVVAVAVGEGYLGRMQG